ncbi:FecR family protein [Sphingobacterium tabacisoli]|uniref:FecR family protein n=1 Tax=Sphingobacterium tabacisoli TaxID=2044855 RepID=A0ABW5KXX2_9SPHI|nr:FecR family protein [Sphingobacterium tabacisoli]
MNKERLLYLITQYRENQCTTAERNELYQLMSQPGIEENILALWDQLYSPTSATLSSEEGEQLFHNIVTTSGVEEDLQKTKSPFIKKLKYIAAVAAAVAVVWGGYSILHLKPSNPLDGYALAQLDTAIIPGSKRAHIIFEDGRSINLEGETARDTIHTGSYLILNRGADGISYHDKENAGSKINETYNTLVTPRGGEYTILLADGTKVWLNADSKLKYPTHFASAQRMVELEGEAYFDVASLEKGSKRVPFFVKTKSQTVEVLGTEFNINSFGEQITTTLIEGKVALNFGSEAKQHLLTPNHQIIYSERTGTHERKEIDPYYFTAWKDGVFAFDNTPLTSVMLDIARWYNVDVEYASDVSDVYFSGKISKLESFESLLQTIQWTGSVKFKINGRRVTIRK